MIIENTNSINIENENKENVDNNDKEKEMENEEELVSKTSQVKTLIQEKMDLEQKLKQQKASKKKMR